jgi:hypothetical protein
MADLQIKKTTENRAVDGKIEQISIENSEQKYNHECSSLKDFTPHFALTECRRLSALTSAQRPHKKGRLAAAAAAASIVPHLQSRPPVARTVSSIRECGP